MSAKHTRSWKILCWNVRGQNSETRQRSVREKVIESQCAIICLQEAKLSSCDRSIIKSICPPKFDQFVESPLHGASGGLLVVWRSDFFQGAFVELKSFGIIIQFTSVHNNE